MKKITRATLKSFINKNRDKLHIKVKSSFDGMVDCVMPVDDGFSPIKQNEYSDNQSKYTFGIAGAWFVGNSRDHFTPYQDEKYTGYEVYNCCGSFILAVEN